MWTLLLISSLLTDPLPELVFSQPGARLPIQAGSDGARVEVCLDSGLAMPLNELRAPDEGRHMLAMIARDALGNVSPARWYLLQIDGSPPALTLTFSNQAVVDDAGQSWLPPGTEVDFKASDSLSGVAQTELTVNGQVHRAPSGLTLPLNQPGANQLTANAQDAVGNASEPVHALVFLDDQPPQGKLELKGLQQRKDGQLFTGPNLQIVAQIEDRQSGLAQWTPHLNGLPVDPARWLGPWQEGAYSASATAMDRVGNQTETESITFFVDAAPPKISHSITSQTFTNANGETFVALPISLNAQALDHHFGACNIEFYEPGSGWQPLDGPVTLEMPTVTLRTRDPLGNAISETLEWAIDRQPPELKLRDAANRERPPGDTIHLSIGGELFPDINDPGAGLSSAEFRMGDEPFRPVPDWFRFRKKDTFTLVIKATDLLGNQTQHQWRIHIGNAQKGERP